MSSEPLYSDPNLAEAALAATKTHKGVGTVLMQLLYEETIGGVNTHPDSRLSRYREKLEAGRKKWIADESSKGAFSLDSDHLVYRAVWDLLHVAGIKPGTFGQALSDEQFARTGKRADFG